jgi:hypothetical protein
MTLWPAIAAVDLQQRPLPDQVTDRHRLEAEGLRLAAAARPVPIALELDQLGQASDQPGDFLSLVVSQPLVRDGDGIPRLAIHMSQDHAIGIDDPIVTGDRLKSPGSGKAALRH